MEQELVAIATPVNLQACNRAQLWPQIVRSHRGDDA
jgi:hypothetical protein